ncbi:MAG TPA: hypothetical protein VNQ90_01190 [Chthoniobacteraceae bacterium]|nr:hypothetical protein [Chthoniobacteraceae bacterium]
MTEISPISAAARRLETARSAWQGIPGPADYWEDFTEPQRGWIADSRSQLPIGPDGARCEGPWILDANHAPPGAGYLHLLMHLHMMEERLQAPYARASGMYPETFIKSKRHAFIHGGRSRNLVNTHIRIRLRGNVALRGSRMTVLVQSQPDAHGPRANWVNTGQHFIITPDWSDQELLLRPDPADWTFLGSRHNLTSLYGYVPIEETLANVNVSFIFVLYPLAIAAVEPVEDLHLAWADRDYTARRDLLPVGHVEFAYVWFHYPVP